VILSAARFAPPCSHACQPCTPSTR
jgi:hypothetical protein